MTDSLFVTSSSNDSGAEVTPDQVIEFARSLRPRLRELHVPEPSGRGAR